MPKAIKTKAAAPAHSDIRVSLGSVIITQSPLGTGVRIVPTAGQMVGDWIVSASAFTKQAHAQLNAKGRLDVCADLTKAKEHLDAAMKTMGQEAPTIQ